MRLKHQLRVEENGARFAALALMVLAEDSLLEGMNPEEMTPEEKKRALDKKYGVDRLDALEHKDVFDWPLSQLVDVLYVQGKLKDEEHTNTDVAYGLGEMLEFLNGASYKLPLTRKALDRLSESQYVAPPESEDSLSNTQGTMAVGTLLRRIRQIAVQELSGSLSGAFQKMLVSLEENIAGLTGTFQVDNSPFRDTDIKSKGVDAKFDALSMAINKETKTTLVRNISMYSLQGEEGTLDVTTGLNKFTSVPIPDTHIWAIKRSDLEEVSGLVDLYRKKNGLGDVGETPEIGTVAVSMFVPFPEHNNHVLFPIRTQDRAKEVELYLEQSSSSSRSWNPQERELTLVGRGSAPYGTIRLVYKDKKELYPFDNSVEDAMDTPVFLAFKLDPDIILNPVTYEPEGSGSLLSKLRSFFIVIKEHRDALHLAGIEGTENYQAIQDYRDSIKKVVSGLSSNHSAIKSLTVVRLPWDMPKNSDDEEGIPMASIDDVKEVTPGMDEAVLSPTEKTHFSGFVDFDQDYRMMIIWSSTSEDTDHEGKGYVSHLLDLLKENAEKAGEIMGGNTPYVYRIKRGAVYRFPTPFSVYGVAARKKQLVSLINDINDKLDSMELNLGLTRGIPNKVDDSDLAFHPGD